MIRNHCLKCYKFPKMKILSTALKYLTYGNPTEKCCLKKCIYNIWCIIFDIHLQKYVTGIKEAYFKKFS